MGTSLAPAGYFSGLLHQLEHLSFLLLFPLLSPSPARSCCLTCDSLELFSLLPPTCSFRRISLAPEVCYALGVPTTWVTFSLLCPGTPIWFSLLKTLTGSSFPYSPAMLSLTPACSAKYQFLELIGIPLHGVPICDPLSLTPQTQILLLQFGHSTDQWPKIGALDFQILTNCSNCYCTNK